jgi:hypothetical protein
MFGAKTLITLIHLGMFRDLSQQVVDLCSGPITIEIDFARSIGKMMQAREPGT